MKTFKELRGMARLQFLWDYYKLPMALIAIAVYVLCYLCYRNVTASFPQLYLAYVNIEAGETLDRELTEGFLEYFQPQEHRSEVKTYHNLVLTDNLQDIDASYLQACQMKILAAIDGEQLDIVLMNQEAFDAFSQNGYLMNVEEYANEYDLLSLRPYFVDNLEILSDNAVEVLLDSSVEYQSEIISYPCGIDISSFPFIEKAGFSDTVYLGILSNTPRKNQVASFLAYIS